MALDNTLEELEKGFHELSTNPGAWTQQALIEGLARSFRQLRDDIANLITVNGLSE